jgi:hypothetical protein
MRKLRSEEKTKAIAVVMQTRSSKNLKRHEQNWDLNKYHVGIFPVVTRPHGSETKEIPWVRAELRTTLSRTNHMHIHSLDFAVVNVSGQPMSSMLQNSIQLKIDPPKMKILITVFLITTRLCTNSCALNSASQSTHAPYSNIEINKTKQTNMGILETKKQTTKRTLHVP